MERRTRPQLGMADPFLEQLAKKEFESELSLLMNEAARSNDSQRKMLPTFIIERLTGAINKSMDRHAKLKASLSRLLAASPPNICDELPDLSRAPSRCESSRSLTLTGINNANNVSVTEEGPGNLHRSPSQSSTTSRASHRPATIKARPAKPFSGYTRKPGTLVTVKDDLPGADALSLQIGCLASVSSVALAKPTTPKVVAATHPPIPSPEAATQIASLWRQLDPLGPVQEFLASFSGVAYLTEVSAQLPSNRGMHPLMADSSEASPPGALRLLDESDCEDEALVSGPVMMVGYLERQLAEKIAQIKFLTNKIDRRTEIMTHIRQTLLKELFILKARHIGPHEVPAFTFFNIIDIVENSQELEVATEAIKNEFESASRSQQQFLDNVQSQFASKRLAMIRQHDAEVEELSNRLRAQAANSEMEMEQMRARHGEVIQAMAMDRDALAAECELLKQSVRNLKSRAKPAKGGAANIAGAQPSIGGRKPKDSASRRASVRLSTASVSYSPTGSTPTGPAFEPFSSTSDGFGSESDTIDPTMPGERSGRGKPKAKAQVAAKKPALVKGPIKQDGNGSRKSLESSEASISERLVLGGSTRPGIGRPLGRRDTVVPSQVAAYQASHDPTEERLSSLTPTKMEHSLPFYSRSAVTPRPGSAINAKEALNDTQKPDQSPLTAPTWQRDDLGEDHGSAIPLLSQTFTGNDETVTKAPRTGLTFATILVLTTEAQLLQQALVLKGLSPLDKVFAGVATMAMISSTTVGSSLTALDLAFDSPAKALMLARDLLRDQAEVISCALHEPCEYSFVAQPPDAVSVVSSHIDVGLRVALNRAVDHAIRYSIPSICCVGSLPIDVLQTLKGDTSTVRAECCLAFNRTASAPAFVGAWEGRGLTSLQLAGLAGYDSQVEHVDYDDFRDSIAGDASDKFRPQLTPARLSAMVKADGAEAPAYAIIVTSVAGTNCHSLFSSLVDKSTAMSVGILSATNTAVIALTTKESAAAEFMLAVPTSPLRAHVSVGVTSLATIVSNLVFTRYSCHFNPTFIFSNFFSAQFMIDGPDTFAAVPTYCHVIDDRQNDRQSKRARALLDCIVSNSVPKKITAKVAADRIQVGESQDVFEVVLWLSSCGHPPPARCKVVAVPILATGTPLPYLAMGLEVPHVPKALFLATIIVGPIPHGRRQLFEQSLQRYVCCNLRSESAFAGAYCNERTSVSSLLMSCSYVLGSSDPMHLLRLVQGLLSDSTRAGALRVVVDVSKAHLLDARNFQCNSSDCPTSFPAKMIDNPSMSSVIANLVATVPPAPSSHLVFLQHADQDASGGAEGEWGALGKGEAASSFTGASVEAATTTIALVSVPASLLSEKETDVSKVGLVPLAKIAQNLHICRSAFLFGFVTPIVVRDGWLALHAQLRKIVSSYFYPLEVVHHGAVKGGKWMVVLLCRPVGTQLVPSSAFHEMLEHLREATESVFLVGDCAELCIPYQEAKGQVTAGMSRRISYCPEVLGVITVLTVRAYAWGKPFVLLSCRAIQGLVGEGPLYSPLHNGKTISIYSRPSRLRRKLAFAAWPALPNDCTIENLIPSPSMLEGLEPPSAGHPSECFITGSFSLHSANVPNTWSGASVLSTIFEEGAEYCYLLIASHANLGSRISFLAGPGAKLVHEALGRLTIHDHQLAASAVSLPHFIIGSPDLGYSLASSLLPDDTSCGISQYNNSSPMQVPSGRDVFVLVFTFHLPDDAGRNELITSAKDIIAGLSPCYGSYVLDALAQKCSPNQCLVLFDDAMAACEFARDAIESILNGPYRASAMSAKGSAVGAVRGAKGIILHRGVPTTAFLIKGDASYDYQTRSHVFGPATAAMVEAAPGIRMHGCLITTHASVAEVEGELERMFMARQLPCDRSTQLPPCFAGLHFLLLQRGMLKGEDLFATLKFSSPTDKASAQTKRVSTSTPPPRPYTATQYQRVVEYCTIVTFLAPGQVSALRGDLLQRLGYDSDSFAMFEAVVSGDVLQLILVPKSGMNSMHSLGSLEAINTFLRNRTLGLAGCGATCTILSAAVPVASLEFTLVSQEGQAQVTAPLVKVKSYEAAMHLACLVHFPSLPVIASPILIEISAGNHFVHPLGSVESLTAPRGPAYGNVNLAVGINISGDAALAKLLTLLSTPIQWGHVAWQALRPYNAALLPSIALPTPSQSLVGAVLHVPKGSFGLHALQRLADTCVVTPVVVVASHTTVTTSDINGLGLVNSYYIAPFLDTGGISAWAQGAEILTRARPLWCVAQLVGPDVGFATAAAGTRPTLRLSPTSIAMLETISDHFKGSEESSIAQPHVFLLKESTEGDSKIESTLNAAFGGPITVLPVKPLDARPEPHRLHGGGEQLWLVRKAAQKGQESLPSLTLKARGPVNHNPIASSYLVASVQCSDAGSQSAIWTGCLTLLSTLKGAAIIAAERQSQSLVRWVVALFDGLADLESLKEALQEVVKSDASGAVFVTVLPQSYWLAYDGEGHVCIPSLDSAATKGAHGLSGRKPPTDASKSTTIVLGCTHASDHLWDTLRENPKAAESIRVRPVSSETHASSTLPLPGADPTDLMLAPRAECMLLEIGVKTNSITGSPTGSSLAAEIAARFVAAYSGPAYTPVKAPDHLSSSLVGTGQEYEEDSDATGRHLLQSGGIGKSLLAGSHTPERGRPLVVPSSGLANPTASPLVESFMEETSLTQGQGMPSADLHNRPPFFEACSSSEPPYKSAPAVGKANSWTQCSNGRFISRSDSCEPFLCDVGVQCDLFGVPIDVEAHGPLDGRVVSAKEDASTRRGYHASEAGGAAQFSLVPYAKLDGQSPQPPSVDAQSRRPQTATRVTVHVVTRETQSSPSRHSNRSEPIAGTWHMSPVPPRLPTHAYAKGYVRIGPESKQQ